jgi:hypothetical protein
MPQKRCFTVFIHVPEYDMSLLSYADIPPAVLAAFHAADPLHTMRVIEVDANTSVEEVEEQVHAYLEDEEILSYATTIFEHEMLTRRIPQCQPAHTLLRSSLA